MITPISKWTCPLLCRDGMGTLRQSSDNWPNGAQAFERSSWEHPGTRALRGCNRKPPRISTVIERWRTPLATRPCTRQSVGSLSPAEARENILSMMPFQAAAPRTIMNLVQFRQEIEKSRQQGYAVHDEEAVQGAGYVNAPILNSDGEAIATVSHSGPVTRVSPDQVPATGAVTSAARAISPAMGFLARDSEIATPAAPRGSAQLDQSTYLDNKIQKAVAHCGACVASALFFH